MKTNVRAEALENVFEPAGIIVDRAMTMLDAEQPLHVAMHSKSGSICKLPSSTRLELCAQY